MSNNRNSSQIYKLILLVVLLYVLLMMVMPRWEKMQVDARDFSRRTAIESLKTSLNMYKNIKGSYPKQINADNCLTPENLDEEFVKSFSDVLFPKDPDPEQGFNGKCLGYFWYKNYIINKNSREEGYILAANIESDDFIRENQLYAGHMCLDSLLKGTDSWDEMGKGIKERSCFVIGEEGDVVMVVGGE
ncbi:hypothetical protein A2483_03005 [Candidatus Peregrinibacteria bacterium RIFOXYC2_FULL_33_13]|nr:MAG: hypothetical protein UR30_C0012G0001 [Candidatus Peregrinibacteria bacterium GW2011_GWC2_33_13]OGJ54444.1 MAG: hypothetical protein A2483_03005 [Candidatus Peregrinibacteria bacterium RIFOXYC2_FULL_33_13]